MKVSDSSIHVKYKRIEVDGKFYVPAEVFDELMEKHKRARETINYTLDKWFESIEKRMADQDRIIKLVERVERAHNRADRLASEIDKARRDMTSVKKMIVNPAETKAAF